MLIVSRATFCGYAAWAFGITSTLEGVPPPSSSSSSSSWLLTANDSTKSPNVESEVWKSSSEFVRSETRSVLQSDPTLAGSFLRLAFHDAATTEYIMTTTPPNNQRELYFGGPNGSVKYELDWFENRGLSKPLRAVLRIHKEQDDNVEKLSLADTIALVGAESVEFAGGPHIPIRLGRLDATEPDSLQRRHPLQMETERSKVETTLPSAGLDSDGLRLFFRSLGLTDEEFVALCGAHDLGRHVSLLGMSKSCLKNLTRDCLEQAPTLLPFIAADDPDRFSNTYFQQLLLWNDRNIQMGSAYFIPTDVTLVVDKDLRKYTTRFANHQHYFYKIFTRAYQKLVNVGTTSSSLY